MQSVTSNAVSRAIPKYVIKSLSVPFWSDYSYKLVPADIGLTTFKNTLLSINATSWNQVADIQIIDDDYIRIRVWTISGTNNATVTLNNSGDVSLTVFALQFPPN
jgi:hypothetical protein